MSPDDKESSGPPSLGSTFVASIAASGGTVFLSLLTGILTARLLGDSGRGQVAAISTWLLTIAWASSVGYYESMVYFASRRAAQPGAIVSTTLLAVPLLSGLGILLAQLVVPIGFSAQSEETQALARLFLCAAPFVMGCEAVNSVLAGQQRFSFLNWLRVAQPAIYALALATLALTHAFTPATVLAAQVLSYGACASFTMIRLLQTIPLHRPSWALAQQCLSFGFRLQGVALGRLVTTRLDIMLLPAFVSAAAVGYYAIATNVSSMVMTLFGTLAMIVFPVAARHVDASFHSVVERGLRLALLGSAATALILGCASPWLLTFVYGEDFVGAVLPFVLLLPGTMLWCGTSILSAGLGALGKPGRASVAQVAGVIATVVGLALTLPTYGIVGAAVTSSVAYAGTFLLTLWMLGSSGGFSLRSAISFASLKDDFSWLRARFLQLASFKHERVPGRPEE